MVIICQLDFSGRPSWSHQLPCSKSSLTRKEFQFCVHVFLMVYLTFCRCTEDYNWSEHWRSDLLSLCWVSAGHPSHHSTSSHLHQRYWISLVKKWRLTAQSLSEHYTVVFSLLFVYCSDQRHLWWLWPRFPCILCLHWPLEQFVPPTGRHLQCQPVYEAL